MLAVYYALRSFVSCIRNKTVSVHVHNTTAVAYINNMGGCHSPVINALTKQLWLWCVQHGSWLIAYHIPGKENVHADSLSRSTDDHWKLNCQIIQNILLRYNISPTIDLFVSRTNFQFKPYVPWFPDPEALTCDAFSFSWSDEVIYAFPPFALIDRVLRKIEQDSSTGVLIFQLWQTQHWLPRLLRLLVTRPVSIPRVPRVLHLPHDPKRQHPLETN